MVCENNTQQFVLKQQQKNIFFKPNANKKTTTTPHINNHTVEVLDCNVFVKLTFVSPSLFSH